MLLCKLYECFSAKENPKHTIEGQTLKMPGIFKKHLNILLANYFSVTITEQNNSIPTDVSWVFIALTVSPRGPIVFLCIFTIWSSQYSDSFFLSF